MQPIRRRLPHEYLEGKWLFPTWCLHGSLPRAMYPPPGKQSAAAAFVWIDRYLDTVRSGPMYLSQESIAQVMEDALHRGESLGNYELGPYVIMANHVHVLLLPKVSPSKLLRSLKGVSAREANIILGLTGSTFWRAESYDHWVRDVREWDRIAGYIENNPVRTGFVQCAADSRWSSASSRNAGLKSGLQAEACATLEDSTFLAIPGAL